MNFNSSTFPSCSTDPTDNAVCLQYFSHALYLYIHSILYPLTSPNESILERFEKLIQGPNGFVEIELELSKQRLMGYLYSWERIESHIKTEQATLKAPHCVTKHPETMNPRYQLIEDRMMVYPSPHHSNCPYREDCESAEVKGLSFWLMYLSRFLHVIDLLKMYVREVENNKYGPYVLERVLSLLGNIVLVQKVEKESGLLVWVLDRKDGKAPKEEDVDGNGIVEGMRAVTLEMQASDESMSGTGEEMDVDV